VAPDPALALTTTLLLASIFATAAVGKLRALDRFEGVVRNYRLLPDRLVRPVVHGLPLVELAAAAGLILPATRPLAAAALILLLLVFAAAMAVNLRRGRHDIDCGCHLGLLKQRISWALVARNLLLAGLASALILGDGHARPLGGLDGVTVLAGTLSLLILYAAFGRLFGLAPAGLKGAR
jgi:uncharacterized membrane protein YphA (DoxX/SURF4 family)